ncbi:DUF6431 domain-containing protein [Proteiniclasticum ruminis]|uniref:DUF6431 domain-containing protein n=1 Tax=Proteiniclasticum ruminis TaxID=398199 RepID=UPI0015A627DE|nr:DUF6431 domain-containing protein [Proteiniclasticum ruminis]
MEKSVCPICMGELEIIGSRRRYSIEATGSRQTLVVRRMRCPNNVCRKIHHELPDILVPYKYMQLRSWRRSSRRILRRFP